MPNFGPVSLIKNMKIQQRNTERASCIFFLLAIFLTYSLDFHHDHRAFRALLRFYDSSIHRFGLNNLKLSFYLLWNSRSFRIIQPNQRIQKKCVVFIMKFDSITTICIGSTLRRKIKKKTAPRNDFSRYPLLFIGFFCLDATNSIHNQLTAVLRNRCSTITTSWIIQRCIFFYFNE